MSIPRLSNALIHHRYPLDPDYEPPANRLCSVCLAIIERSDALDLIIERNMIVELKRERWDHHSSMSELYQSVLNGCHLCSLLYASCCSEVFESPDCLPQGQLTLRIVPIRPETGLETYIGSVQPCFWFRLGLESSLPKWRGSLTTFNSVRDTCSLGHSTSQHCDESCSWDNIQNECLKTSSTASEATLELARSWLKACIAQHSLCSSLTGDGWPKRLLVLSGNSQTPCLHLATVAPGCSLDSYLTLSHCWGTEPIFKLKQDNYHAFMKDIPFGSLSRTFQDAVQITLRLGYTRLWIDALCIIQDDSTDVEAEVPNMGYIYGNSICTIAALSSVKSADGCFAARKPLCRVPCRLRTKGGNDFVLACEDMAMYIRNVSPTHGTTAFEHGASYDDSQIPSLHRRAWVVQERVLSPRTLYFSTLGIHWECCESNLSDVDPHAGRNIHDRSKLKMNMSSMLGKQSKKTFAASSVDETQPVPGDSCECNVGIENLNDCHEKWLRLVEIYSHSRLTKTTDRWPALAGMAQIIESAMNIQILAGAWREYLLGDMLWTSANLSLRSDQHKTYSKSKRLDNGQPTWSWLSVEGGVTFGSQDSNDIEFMAKILSVNSKLRSGPGNELHLTIEGLIFRCEIADGPSGPTLVSPELFKDSNTHTETELAWLGLLEYQYDFHINATQRSEAWALAFTRTRDHDSASESVPGFLRQKMLSGDVRQHSLTGLIIVLDPVDGSKWSRVGTFSYRFRFFGFEIDHVNEILAKRTRIDLY